MKGNLTALIILDGYGYTPNEEGNAVLAASSPYLDSFIQNTPHTFIDASGLAVGLPEGQMGNSEVGHLNIGAGRVVYQELTRITKSIEDGDFFTKEAFLECIRHLKSKDAALHLMGLVSDGGVHSHLTHLFGLLELAKRENVKQVYVHCLMDGRDTAPNSGAGFIAELQEKMKELGIGEVATISGRFYAMDRDNRWERVEKAYNALVLGEGIQADDAVDSMKASYAQEITDEFILPTVIKTKENSRIKEGDSIIFFNFRPDRAREITRTFIDPEFDGFERKKGYFPVFYVTMTRYDATFKNVAIAYKPENVENTLGEYISNKGIKQLRIAETEKYAHVTYFFNGGVEKQYPGEDRELIPSPHVATYDLKPEMSAPEVTEKVLDAIASDQYKMIILNYANCDMVGHTGIMEAAEKAVATVDNCVGKVIDAILKKSGNVILTADHGNAEKMIDYDTKKPWTAHTTNQVYCAVAGVGDVTLRKGGRLADLAPTILDLMDMDTPPEMTGKTLIKK